jgi:hypothetical protein
MLLSNAVLYRINLFFKGNIYFTFSRGGKGPGVSEGVGNPVYDTFNEGQPLEEVGFKHKASRHSIKETLCARIFRNNTLENARIPHKDRQTKRLKIPRQPI